MDLEASCIRSPGAGTGGAERTLQPPFRALVGAPLAARARGGARPEIILRPELRPAHATLERIWSRLAAGCRFPRPAGFAMDDFAVGLFDSAEAAPGSARPGFAWVEAVELSSPGPHPAIAAASVLRALAAGLGRRAAGDPDSATAFGAAVAHALTAVVPRAEEQATCDLAAEALFAEGLTAGEPHAEHSDLHAEAFWEAARPYLALLSRRFRLRGAACGPGVAAERSAA